MGYQEAALPGEAARGQLQRGADSARWPERAQSLREGHGGRCARRLHGFCEGRGEERLGENASGKGKGAYSRCRVGASGTPCGGSSCAKAIRSRGPSACRAASTGCCCIACGAVSSPRRNRAKTRRVKTGCNYCSCNSFRSCGNSSNHSGGSTCSSGRSGKRPDKRPGQSSEAPSGQAGYRKAGLAPSQAGSGLVSGEATGSYLEERGQAGNCDQHNSQSQAAGWCKAGHGHARQANSSAEAVVDSLRPPGRLR